MVSASHPRAARAAVRGAAPADSRAVCTATVEGKSPSGKQEGGEPADAASNRRVRLGELGLVEGLAGLGIASFGSMLGMVPRIATLGAGADVDRIAAAHRTTQPKHVVTATSALYTCDQTVDQAGQGRQPPRCSEAQQVAPLPTN